MREAVGYLCINRKGAQTDAQLPYKPSKSLQVAHVGTYASPGGSAPISVADKQLCHTRHASNARTRLHTQGKNAISIRCIVDVMEFAVE